MNHNQNSTNLFILICLSLIVLDLILKSVVSSNIPQGEYQPILGGLLTIGSVKTVNNVYGSVLSTQIWPIIKILLQALFVFMFLRMQRLDIHSLYKYASTMMVFGWLGNYIDKFVLFGEDSSYQHLDYFAIAGIGTFMNISSLLVSIGLLLFLLALLLGYKHLGKVFKRN